LSRIVTPSVFSPGSVGFAPPALGEYRPKLSPARNRACLAAKVAADNKGKDILVLDLRALTPMFDYFVLSTGASRRQVHTIVEETDAALRAAGDTRMSVEGYDTSKWIVQDYGDVLTHTFDPDTRDYYRLEELWADAPHIDWEREFDPEAIAEDEANEADEDDELSELDAE
jgi:ribosome-associated protein